MKVISQWDYNEQSYGDVTMQMQLPMQLNVLSPKILMTREKYNTTLLFLNKV